jgi:hypothetical protein|tara:strand:- start:1383 stop:1619 length:237 start_codon:yes stop_codon:yes gene_type:complete
MTTSSKAAKLRVGDLVEHDTQHEGYPHEEGPGLLVRLSKRGSSPELNLWEVKFFTGETFEMLEEYLKKIQGAIDTNGR